VTGGCGFIGSNFVLRWLKHSTEPVLVLDKMTYASNMMNFESAVGQPNLTIMKGDIGDRKLISQLLAAHQPRAILNFAAESHVDRSILGPGEFIQTNIVGTFGLLESSRDYWANLAVSAKNKFRFLHVSTDEVYGSLGAGEPAFNEENTYKPNSPYSASKAASDHLVRAWHHTYGLPTITTNCSNNYGPFHFPEKLIPLIITNALAGKPLPIYGDGLQIRDWLYVEDHCRAIEMALERGHPGETYNIGGNNEKANIDIVRQICRMLDVANPRADGALYEAQIAHVEDRPGHDRRYAVDATKTKTELGWNPQETFESGIAKTIDWYLSNLSWVENVKSGAYREWMVQQYGQG
jgi:dTDP-glucose 4,6-dehydratase